MKRSTVCLAFSLFLGLTVQQTNASVMSFSNACANNGSTCSSDPSTSISSNADAVFNSTNYAHAKTGPGTIGVEARSDNSTESQATASWQDVWSPVVATVGPLFAPNIGFKYHIDGVIDPRFLDPTSADNVYMDINFKYDFYVGSSQKSFRFDDCYDGGNCGLTATIDGNDISNNVIYGTNSLGQTTFSLDYYQAPTSMAWYQLGCSAPVGNPYACWWGDAMSATIDVAPYSSSVIGDFNNSFINTFSVELIAADTNSMLASEGGRQTTLLQPTNGGTVPEPPSLLLIGTGIATMVQFVRKKVSNQQA